MNNFKEILANTNSISHRKPIYGVGINDADYQTQPIINDKTERCPFYLVWRCMLSRCYSESYQNKFPTYKGCTVVKGWFIFSSFKNWMQKQEWKGMALDKDILLSENKVYGPNSCIFVTPEINGLLNKVERSRGECPIGVAKTKTSRYQASCCVRSVKKTIGTFDTPEEAGNAYLKFKSSHVHEAALQQTDPRLKAALIRISGEIARGEYYK